MPNIADAIAIALVAVSKLRPELPPVVSPNETVAIERTDPGNFVWPTPNAPQLTAAPPARIIGGKPCALVSSENMVVNANTAFGFLNPSRSKRF